MPAWAGNGFHPPTIGCATDEKPEWRHSYLSPCVHLTAKAFSPNSNVQHVDRWCGLTGNAMKGRVATMKILRKSAGAVRQCLERVQVNLRVLAGPDELTY